MLELLLALMVQASVLTGLDLPKNNAVPAVDFKTQEQIQEAIKVPANYTVAAYYRNGSYTITLPVGWTGDTALQQSYMLHEIVHYLQDINGAQYRCPQMKEAEAYSAQIEFLKRYGIDFFKVTKLNEMALMMLTMCSEE